MRIALHAVGEAGRRAGRILLAERDLAALGLYGHEGAPVSDRRTMAIRELTGFTVLATDDEGAADAFAGIAADDGLSCVLTAASVDPAVAERFTPAGTTLLVGANLAQGIAESLAVHEMARTDEIRAITVAWTVPGKPLRRGEAVAFPDPVGARWGRKLTKGRRDGTPVRIEVPIGGDWAAASAEVTGRIGGETVTRLVGVADHADHLAGIALAAGAIAVATGAYGPGVRRPSDAAPAYLEAALRVGLGVAALTE